jgi:hypothetical protein
VLELKPRQILQSWLAARYRRQVLPDRLVDRLRLVFDFLEKQGKEHALGILGYWFNFDPHDVELPPDQSYELWLNIIYSIDNPAIEEDAKNLAASVRKKFHELMKAAADLGTVDLRHCEAYSEQEFTLRDLRDNIEYRLGYLSHRINAPGPIV